MDGRGYAVVAGGLHVAIVVPPLVGHLIPSLGFASQMVLSGHRVTYVTHEKHRDLVESVSATLAPTTVPYDGLSSGFVEHPIFGPIVNVIRAGTLEIEADLDNLVARFQADPVDVVCVGYASQIGFPLADRLSVPRVTLYSTYAWNRRIEEETYGTLVHEGALRSAVNERRELADKIGFSPNHTIPFGPPSRINLVPLPRFFQYYSESFDSSYVFMGPSIEAHPGDGYWEPRSVERPLLYISLGTTYNDNIAFFRSCIEQFGEGQFEVAMSVGERIRIEDLGAVPENIEVRRSFPQISVLKHAAVFLSHAGMGSTMEALLLGVPIVAVPQQGDQVLNARKIQELGIGEYCPPAVGLGLDSMADAVRRVAGDREIRDRLTRLRTEIDDDSGIAAGVRAVASLC